MVIEILKNKKRNGVRNRNRNLIEILIFHWPADRVTMGPKSQIISSTPTFRLPLIVWWKELDDQE